MRDDPLFIISNGDGYVFDLSKISAEWRDAILRELDPPFPFAPLFSGTGERLDQPPTESDAAFLRSLGIDPA